MLPTHSSGLALLAISGFACNVLDRRPRESEACKFTVRAALELAQGLMIDIALCSAFGACLPAGVKPIAKPVSGMGEVCCVGNHLYSFTKSRAAGRPGSSYVKKIVKCCGCTI